MRQKNDTAAAAALAVVSDPQDPLRCALSNPLFPRLCLSFVGSVSSHFFDSLSFVLPHSTTITNNITKNMRLRSGKATGSTNGGSPFPNTSVLTATLAVNDPIIFYHEAWLVVIDFKRRWLEDMKTIDDLRAQVTRWSEAHDAMEKEVTAAHNELFGPRIQTLRDALSQPLQQPMSDTESEQE